MPVNSYKAILTYDGTHYFGWQKAGLSRTIQGELQQALAQVTQENVQPEAASRTDRGVHANGQVVQFLLEAAKDPISLQRSLNGVLPEDIRVIHLEKADFHPTLDAVAKKYQYKLCLDPVQDPTQRLYAWHIFKPVDLEKMKKAAADLLGTHDFSAFSNEATCPLSSEPCTIDRDPICTLHSIDIAPQEILICGNRFLYKMVRNIVGTLVHIGCGKIPADALPSILASRDRRKAGLTAPAHGLYLHQVIYPLS